MKLGKWLQRNGVSQQNLAGKIGIAQASVGRIVRGDPPTLRIAALIRAITHEEVDWEDMLPPDFLKRLRRVQKSSEFVDRKAS